ncbi:MAG TPA: hypothetical protein VGB99_17705 [Acidobacteriota bacterium]
MNRAVRSFGLSLLAAALVLALAGLGGAEDVGRISLSQSVRAGSAVLEPGLYTVAIEDGGTKTLTAAGETFTQSGRSEIVLRHNGDVVSSELAVVPTGRHPNTLPSSPTGSSRTRVYTQTLRSDTPPPSGEPQRLFRVVVYRGGETLLGYYELL